jgi:DNA-binding beta-propeller fold protein YncE
MKEPLARSARRAAGLVAVAVAVALVAAPGALAATPFGSLSQLLSPNNCVGPATECGTAPIGSVNGAEGVVVSPDGKNVYVVDGSDASISEFARNPDGSLTQLPSPNNCIAQSTSTTTSCGNKTANGLTFPGAIAISPDGKTVYVAGEDSNSVGAIAEFTRNADGSLSPLACIGEDASQGVQTTCGSTGHGLFEPRAVEVSPDGKNVYVADGLMNSVAWLARAANGSLSQPGGAANCLQETGSNPENDGPDCSPETARGLSGAGSLAISPDGHNVYVGGFSSIAELTRNADGSLTQLTGANNCIEEHGGSDCGTETGIGLRSIASLDVSPDGHNLYSSSGNYTGAVAEFTRNGDGSLTQLASPNNCIEENPSGDGTQAPEGCGTNTGHGLGSGGALAVSPDGANVYAGATGDDCNSPCHNAVAEFARNVGGSLTQLASPDNCIEEAQGATGDCGNTTGHGLSSGSPPGVAISPGADSVYVTGNSPGAIAEFARLLPTLTVSLTGSGSGTVADTTGAISCPSTCSHAFPIGAVVTLTAGPHPGSSFVGWSGGGCAGTSTCQVTMSADTAVTATFTAQSAPTAVVTGAPSVGSTTAGFIGAVNPDGLPATAFFQFGLDAKYTGAGPLAFTQSTPAQSVGSDFTSHTISATVTGLVPNALYHVRLVATNGDGTTFGPDVTFTTVKTASPGPPTLGKTFNIAPVSGVVLILLHGQLIPLTEGQQIQKNTLIDALHGTLSVTTALPGGGGGARDAAAKKKKPKPKVKTQTGQFGGAIFKIGQATSGANKGLATLTLVEGAFSGAPSYAECKAHTAAEATAAALSSKTLQLLHASAHGKFRTSGRYSAATVRGTKWTIADKCNGTLTHDITDSVSVQDFVRHKTIVLHAGQSYLAKAPKHK